MKIETVRELNPIPTVSAESTTATGEQGKPIISEPVTDSGTENASIVEQHASQFPGFDPAVHAVDENGNPFQRTYKGQVLPGEWRKKRKGSGALAMVAETVRVDMLETAKQVCNIVISGLVMIFGEQWAPKEKAEGDALAGAVKNYFDSKGGVAMSPGVALLLVVGAYSLERIAHEKTRSKLSKMGSWIRGVFKKS